MVLLSCLRQSTILSKAHYRISEFQKISAKQMIENFANNLIK
jgi:hypothetical protein